MTPIQLYTDEEQPTTTEKQFMPRDESGRGYRMRLFSIKDRDNCHQGTFETSDNRLYSQRFWKTGPGSTSLEKLESIKGKWINCDINLTEKGFQQIVNVELADEPEEYEPPTPQTTDEYLESLPEPTQDEVPF